MGSSTASLQVALVITAIFSLMLLHSCMGQQPAAPAPAPLDCSNCSTNCSQRCQAMADAQARSCSATLVAVYDSCFQAVATHRCGSYYYAVARRSCTVATCTPILCGSLCVCSSCDTCTIAARQAYSSCIKSVNMQFCMPDCMKRCREFGYCVVSG